MARNTTTESVTEETVVEAATATEEMVSPYKASQLLEADGIAVRPQMLYSYVKDGRIPSTDKKISTQDLKAWAAEYVTKKADREAKRQAKLEAELTSTEAEVTEAE